MLLEQLTKQEEGQEQDESTWNLAMSSGTCLGLMARVAGNDLVPVVGFAAWGHKGVGFLRGGGAWERERGGKRGGRVFWAAAVVSSCLSLPAPP